MRLGGKLVKNIADPIEWAETLKKKGYRSGICPLTNAASDIDAAHLLKVAKAYDLVIAEVGVWNSPLDPNPKIRYESIDYCKKQLDLADRVSANCCVNISGSRGIVRNAPDALNFSEETFDMIVDVVREIVDAVKPTNTFYTLECMPYMYPDNISSYQRLIKAIDRKSFAVHFDPVNIITTPRLYYNNGQMIREFMKAFGSQIKSCHAKDILFQEGFPIQIQEVRPGLGILDYKTFITAINDLNKEMPLIIEHLPSEHEYELAYKYIKDRSSEISKD